MANAWIGADALLWILSTSDSFSFSNLAATDHKEEDGILDEGDLCSDPAQSFLPSFKTISDQIQENIWMFFKYLQDRARHMGEFSSERELKSYSVCVWAFVCFFWIGVLLITLCLLTGHKNEISWLASQGYGAPQSPGQRGAKALFLQLEVTTLN